MMKSCVLSTVRVIDWKWNGPAFCDVRQATRIAVVTMASVAPRLPSRSDAQARAGYTR